MYVTPGELRDTIGAVELSQLATPAGRRALAPAKLDAAIAGTLATTDADYADAVRAVATITEALAVRSSYCDGFFSRYSPLPIPSGFVPDVVKQIVVALARYDLANDAPTATITKRYSDARADLQAIADGTLVLAIPVGSGTALDSDIATTGELDPIYSRCSTRRFQDPYGTRP